MPEERRDVSGWVDVVSAVLWAWDAASRERCGIHAVPSCLLVRLAGRLRHRSHGPASWSCGDWRVLALDERQLQERSW